MANNEYKDNDLALAELTSIYQQRLQKVRKSNDLVLKANFDLTARQQQIILFLISKVKPDDEDFKEYIFSVKDYCKIAGIQFDKIGGHIYEEIKDSIKELADKSKWITMSDNSNKQVLIRWLESPTIDTGKGEISVKLNFNLKPYLLQLNKNFVEYEIINPLRLNSKYSIRLYELLKTIHYNKSLPYETIVPLEELKQRIGAYGKSYNVYAEFSKVLTKAIAEVNEKTDILVTWKPKRTGRKISDIIFHLETREGAELLQQNAKSQLALSKYLE